MPPAAERTAAGSSTSLPRDPPLRPFPDAVVFETGGPAAPAGNSLVPIRFYWGGVCRFYTKSSYL